MPRSVFTEAYEEFVQRLIALRRAGGLSQAELAARLGKPQQFISVVETRVRRLDVIELYAMLTALGVDPETFVRDLYRSLPRTITI